MAENITKQETGRLKTADAVGWTRVYFTLLTWCSLIITSTLAYTDLGGKDNSFLFPVGFYALFLLVFPYINYEPGRGWVKSARWAIWRRNTGESKLWRRLVFVGGCFIFIFWMNFYHPIFMTMYFVLMGHTMGLFNWRAAVPVASMEVLTLLFQNGLFSTDARLSTDGFISLAISIFFAFLNVVVIVALINSRQKSEMLVQQLKAAKAQLEEAHAQEKELAVFRERDRMAREMHDVLGHALVLVAVKIEAAQRLQAVDPERASSELEATKELVRQSMADLRVSLAELRSPAMDAADKPMAQALKDWANLTAKEGKFNVQVNFEADIETVPVPIQHALWSVGREALLNIVKHARARQVELNLFFKDNQVFLTIADDGVGIPNLAEGRARLEVEGHYGMRGMRERLELLGGHFTVRPGREGVGTLVLASIPLPLPQPTAVERPPSQFAPIKGWLFR